MKVEVKNQGLTKIEEDEIDALLDRMDDSLSSDLEKMWYLLDLVWDECDCNNVDLDWEKIEAFYSHPVWILNGLFSEQDEESVKHRKAIEEWVSSKKISEILDYGGGNGSIARMLSKSNDRLKISIFEPHPSRFGLSKISAFSNICYVDKVSKNKQYNCLISIDVLEHVSDPLETLSEMVDCVELNGFLVISAPFYPVIKCHLPKNFHFRYTFNIFAKIMGLKVVGCIGNKQQTVYIKVKDKHLNWKNIRIMEGVSKAGFPVIDFAKGVVRSLYQRIRG